MDRHARFEAVYGTHNAAVRTYVRRRIDAQDADDVVADVFVVVWRRLDELPDDPLPWLLGIARRAVANRWRGASRAAALRDRLAAEAPGETPSPAAGSDARQALQALSRLGEKDREALLLVAWEDLTPARAAASLGISANAFSARLSRARRRFERALEQTAGPATDTPGRLKKEMSS